MALDITTFLVWTLRIVLPVLFFAIYFRLQGVKQQPVSRKNVITRDRFLQLKESVKGRPTPDSMKNIAMKDQTQAPHLFSGTGRAPRPERGRRVSDEPKVEKKKRSDRHEKKELEATPEATSAAKDQMHLESLLNYVAFNRKEQQRNFLPDSSGGDLPPPPKKGDDVEDGGVLEPSNLSGAAADKANSEAQMVLRGAMGIQRPDVARHLYDCLIEAHVEISETTFELMIDVCVAASDLKGASDFLMKLETAGFKPNSDVLDKVLDLYTKQQETESLKASAEVEAVLGAVLSEAGDDSAEKHGEEASAVQWMQQPVAAMIPMFNWDAIEDDDDDDDGDEPTTKLSSDAPVFVPSFLPSASQKDSQEYSAYAPYSGDEQYGRYTSSSWSSWDQGWESWDQGWDQPDRGSRYTDKDKGKGKGKGKGKWKSKGDWEDGWNAKSGWGKSERDKGSSSKDSPKDDRYQAEDSQQEVEKKAYVKDAKSWKKPEVLKWKPKAES